MKKREDERDSNCSIKSWSSRSDIESGTGEELSRDLTVLGPFAFGVFEGLSTRELLAEDSSKSLGALFPFAFGFAFDAAAAEFVPGKRLGVEGVCGVGADGPREEDDDDTATGTGRGRGREGPR